MWVWTSMTAIVSGLHTVGGEVHLYSPQSGPVGIEPRRRTCAAWIPVGMAFSLGSPTINLTLLDQLVHSRNSSGRAIVRHP